MMFTPLAASGIFKNFQGHLSFETNLKERKYGFRDRCTRKVEINESITLPAIKQPVRIPGPAEANGVAASFSGKYKIVNGSLIYSGLALYNKRIYDAADWPDFKAAVEAQNKLSAKPIVVEL
jgi:hypothetical protein